MHKSFTLTLFLVTSLISIAQKTKPPKTTILLRPYAEGGIAFIMNSALKKNYQTNTMFYFGAGVRLGNPLKHNLLPYLQLTWAQHTHRYNNERTRDSALNFREFATGFIIPLFKNKEHLLRAKTGFIYASIQDDIARKNVKGKGFQVGLGFEEKLNKHFRFFVDASYNLIKVQSGISRDYDLAKLTLGIII
jgi:hypothetical protein